MIFFHLVAYLDSCIIDKVGKYYFNITSRFLTTEYKVSEYCIFLPKHPKLLSLLSICV